MKADSTANRLIDNEMSPLHVCLISVIVWTQYKCEPSPSGDAQTECFACIFYTYGGVDGQLKY